jgi:hypothetical protein
MPVKKCLSICNEFSENECNPPRCKYINGKSRKYCRISHKYKMNKVNCNVTRRIKKKDIETVARKKIGNLVKSSKLFLNIVCPNSGSCIAFGNHTKELNNYFKGFTDFHYAVSPITRLGSVTGNGFIKEIEYVKQGYTSHAILKSSQSPSSDNLVYEYLVGIKYINRILKSFPCFIETYGLYYYDTNANWQAIKSSMPLNKSILNSLILQKDIDYIKACRKSTYAAILIQHIKNARQLKEMSIRTGFMNSDLIYVLFIIYQALSSLSKNFTHYDLHNENILLYEPEAGKFIEYHYHYNDGSVISFYCKYVPKIIDYGRCFFDNGNLKSRKIYDKICSIRECDPNCGNNMGFGWMDPIPSFHISSSKKNESHDLRLLNILKTNINQHFKNGSVKPTSKTFKETNKILKKIVYGIGINERENRIYGTKENLSISPDKIYNVNGAYFKMRDAIKMPDIINENKKDFQNMIKLGDLHIYENRQQMNYIKV